MTAPRPCRSLNVRLRIGTAVLATLLGLVALPLAACEVDVLPLQFGTINPLHANTSDSATSLSVTCEPAASYTIALGEGAGGYADRRMQSAAHTLAYNLYTEPGRSFVWGDGTGGTLTVSGSDDGSTATHTIYARVPAQPQAAPGAYADSIVVTVSF